LGERLALDAEDRLHPAFRFETLVGLSESVIEREDGVVAHCSVEGDGEDVVGGFCGCAAERDRRVRRLGENVLDGVV
jgi:hypothetical protein